MTRYRVWCLSWDDEEEHGSDIVSDPTGLLPVERHTIHVAYRNVDCAVEAAELYAEWAYDNRDGYECRWPLEFRVRKPDGTTQDVSVDRHCDPTFSGRLLKEGG